MAHELLGERFDIHGGGNDLTFPHHENEIAQSKCAGHAFANVWMHNEMLQVEGKKMSKSLGNFFTVRDLLDGNWSGGWKVPGEVIRFVFLSTHYRKPMDWTEAKAREAEGILEQLGLVLAGYQYMFDERAIPSGEVVEALADDLNSSLALTTVRRMLKELSNRDLESSVDHAKFEEVAARLIGSLSLLGFHAKFLVELATRSKKAPSTEVADLISLLLEERSLARNAKDFARADALRDGFAAAGVLVKDTPEGAEWELSPDFDPTKLEALK